MLKTAICDLFGIEHPIIQGGMAHLGTVELVSAVSNAGGLGIIGAGYYQPDWVRQQIRLTKQQTSQPFGINIPLTSPFAKEVIEIILEEKVAIVTTGLGNPEPCIPRFRQAGIKIIPVVASVERAKLLEKAGVDAIVAEGTESGGHVGETTTMALALGAQGIQVGTRFACSQECIAHPRYKERILEANDRSTVVTGYTTGFSLRALKNSLTEQYLALEQAGASKEELDLFGQGRMHLGLIEGDTDDGSLLSGQIAGLIKEIKPVRVIIDEMIAEAETIISSLKNFQRGD